ncbi:Patatin [Methylocella silvestris BL2]|uniref:Patatin n=1 Tax=Methylocella silvestris (strain DSM 15510 / CIP 108128 / LMG 27833 / NCIMB 13906 / BL2) TaxID=395965 RepID=B8ESD8_METSB|nr:patatin-like phospholipase family protein [Methylocella silvestris]ACK49828.1 Patatin [Methylocella silvestris BL2]
MTTSATHDEIYGAAKEPPEAPPRESRRQKPGPDVGQIVLVFQGGGALGAYQAGVYEALHEAGIEPDWVIGTSIGAINSSLIAGNEPEQRLDRLREFWRRVEESPALDFFGATPWLGRSLPNWMTLTQGVADFFRPNPLAFLGLHIPMAPEAAGYYSTRPLERTLCELVNFERLSACAPRLTVGAANLRTSDMRYFDSREAKLTARHIMASGALPPAFPAIRIDGDLYWDGGLLSNTPVEAVFDDNPRRHSLVIAVHIWNPQGPEPESIWQVMHRQKEVQYASRALSHIKRQKQIHRLRHIIAELAARLPDDERLSPQVQEMAAYGCLTQTHVVRLLAPAQDGEDHTKDIDFSRRGIKTRWDAGRADAASILEDAPWDREVDALEGFHLHELRRMTLETV